MASAGAGSPESPGSPGSGDGPGSARLPRGYARGEGRRPVQRPVWVDLDALFGSPPEDAARLVPDGLELTGEVRGLLHYWARASDGRWLAVVSFRLPYRPDNRNSPGLEVRWTPVPAASVRPGPASSAAGPAR